eukprot:CAMPEP_0201137512 /NCGR_PEP_ID=MMETSP0850-20130426/55449_1 /ASSEMBLY_ACC=CAM_ASM_000622 /TAXON_ID=183588 /ORGANISM="Pseudo-nitzschia fraudulenta, Strain WWA7" /LENGTH=73 /DNA_ID=CAMNT_0047408871 /DNA_START=552 /DNA_END=773 /DNA_ORIENTATION=-
MRLFIQRGSNILFYACEIGIQIPRCDSHIMPVMNRSTLNACGHLPFNQTGIFGDAYGFMPVMDKIRDFSIIPS